MNVIARLIVGGIIAFATVVILENSKKQYEEDARKHRERNKDKEKDATPEQAAAEFSEANTHDKYLFDYETYGAPSSKRKITRSIKEIMGEYDTRRIGRTGDRNGRLGNYDGKYKALYLLTKSKNLAVIEDLETNYIEKFKAKLDNDKPGMLGASETIDGWYYLYIAVA